MPQGKWTEVGKGEQLRRNPLLINSTVNQLGDEEGRYYEEALSCRSKSVLNKG